MLTLLLLHDLTHCVLMLLTQTDDTEEQSSFAVILCCTDPSVFTSSQSDDSFTLVIDGDSISVDSTPASIEAVAGEPPQIDSHNS